MTLSDERNKLYNLFQSDEYKSVVSKVLQLIEEQDKEFIKRVKKKLTKSHGCTVCNALAFIDEEAGDNLIK